MDTSHVPTRRGDPARGMNDPARSFPVNDPDSPARRDPPQPAFVSSFEVESRRGVLAAEPTAGLIMTRDVKSCRPDRTLLCAASAMQRGDCRFLPILDREGRPIAVLTDGDICEIGASDHRPLRDILVSEAMSREIFTCRPEDPVSRILATMKTRRIRHLPVVHDDGAAVRVDQPDDVLEEDALTGARGAEQRHGLALTDDEVDPVQDDLLPEPLVDVAQLDHCCSSRLARSTSSSRMSTELATTAPVVERPTPSAPCWVLKPM